VPAVPSRYLILTNLRVSFLGEVLSRRNPLVWTLNKKFPSIRENLVTHRTE
jgi:hypothetical protein